MEKEDAYNKIVSLESEIIQLKALKAIDFNKTPEKSAIEEQISGENNHLESAESFEFAPSKTPIISTSPVHDPKVYQKYRDFQNKFIKSSGVSSNIKNKRNSMGHISHNFDSFAYKKLEITQNNTDQKEKVEKEETPYTNNDSFR